MLDQMRNWGRTWVVQALFILLMVAFAFWGVGSVLGSRVHPVAMVNGNRILASELDHQTEQLKRNITQVYGANAALLLRSVNLRQEALNQMIQERLVADEARHIGIRVSDQSLADNIATDPHFQDGGRFDPQRYQEILQENELLPSDYEASVRASLVEGALRQMVDQGVQVSDADARHAYDLKNQKISVAYVEIPAQDFVAKISPTPDQLEAFYKSHQDAFREPDRIKVAYIRYDSALMAAKITPSDKDIEDYYKSNLKKMYSHPDEVHARHILIEVQPGATADQKAKAKARAEDILKQLKNGADFQKLAKEDSQDPGSRLSGGDLGTFGRNQMVKPFEDAAFSMKPGELRLVETKFGYHVVKLEASTPAHVDKLDQVRPKIIEAIRSQQGPRMAREALDEDVTAALAGGDLKDLAKKRGFEVVETPLFSQHEASAVLKNQNLTDTAFKLEVGQVSAVPGGNAAPYLVKLISRDPAHVPPLKDIEAKVREAYVRDTSQSQALAKAQKLLTQMKDAAGFGKIAQANNLTIHKTDSFARSSNSVPELGSFPEVTDAAGDIAKLPGLIPRVMENKGDAYIFEVLDRTMPSDEDWKAAQKDFIEEFSQQRRADAWNHFLDALKSRARISIDADQIGANAPEPPSQPRPL